MDDEQLVHTLRETKAVRGSAMTLGEVQSIPDRIMTGEWFFDRADPHVLLAWARMGEEWVKVAVRLDRKPKGTRGIVVNQIVTGGVVREQNLKAGNYEKI
ncbi:hypothetical protein MASR1M90_15740 [Desulfovibrionales bacterium]